MTKYLIEEIKPSQTIMKIGANYGYFSILAAKLVGKEGRVIACEPNPRCLELFHDSMVLNGLEDRIIIRPEAIVGPVIMDNHWSSKTTFLTNPKYLGCSMLTGMLANPKSLVHGPGDEEIVVVLNTVDRIIEAEEIEGLDWVIVDAEGAEPYILSGMEKACSLSPNLRIIMEFSPRYILDTGTYPEGILEHLSTDIEKMGFHIRRIFDLDSGGSLDSSLDCVLGFNTLDILRFNTLDILKTLFKQGGTKQLLLLR
jgi:FkbM family methyltransferase